jgi:hypothetical protein
MLIVFPIPPHSRTGHIVNYAFKGAPYLPLILPVAQGKFASCIISFFRQNVQQQKSKEIQKNLKNGFEKYLHLKLNRICQILQDCISTFKQRFFANIQEN